MPSPPVLGTKIHSGKSIGSPSANASNIANNTHATLFQIHMQLTPFKSLATAACYVLPTAQIPQTRHGAGSLDHHRATHSGPSMFSAHIPKPKQRFQESTHASSTIEPFRRRMLEGGPTHLGQPGALHPSKSISIFNVFKHTCLFSLQRGLWLGL